LPIILKDNTYKDISLLKEKKWQYSKEGWTEIQRELYNTEIGNLTSIDKITEMIKSTALKYFHLKTREFKDKPNKPWWNKECNDIIKEKK